jgi:hypothetical protein
MTLNDLIEELENARKEKGGDSEVLISFNKKPISGLSELVTGNILDIIYSDNPENGKIGIWAQENAE